MPGPEVIFVGGTDTLQLEKDGPIYEPGAVMPASLSWEQRLGLQRAGVRFETRHPEPTPEPKAATAKSAPADPVKEDAKA